MAVVNNDVSAEILIAAIVILDFSCPQMNATVLVSVVFTHSLVSTIHECYIKIAYCDIDINLHVLSR